MSSLSNKPHTSTEESGWTSYFDDFFNNNYHDINNNNHKSSSSLSLSTSSSLLSDATSLVDKNVILFHNNKNNQHLEKEFSLNKNGKTNSSFKKRKNIVHHAFDLEDTATSPLNTTPKEKGNTSGQKELSLLNGKDSDCTELKKRGLCVVPL